MEKYKFHVSFFQAAISKFGLKIVFSCLFMVLSGIVATWICMIGSGIYQSGVSNLSTIGYAWIAVYAVLMVIMTAAILIVANKIAIRPVVEIIYRTEHISEEGIAMGAEADLIAAGGLPAIKEIAYIAERLQSCIAQIVEITVLMVNFSSGDISYQVNKAKFDPNLIIFLEGFQKKLNELVVNTRENIKQIEIAGQELTKASEESGRATQQIAASSQQVARGAAEQAEGLQKSTQGMNQLTKAVEQIATGAQEQTKLVEKASNLVLSLSEAIKLIDENAQKSLNNAKLSRDEAGKGAEVAG